jgi:predicted amidohydrolase YtcJ
MHSVDCGPPRVRTAVQLRDALRTAPPGDWVRGVGYHESVAGLLDRDVLDGMVPDRPVRVQHRGGALWTVNSAGLAALAADLVGPDVERAADGRPTGRLWRYDARLHAILGARPPDLTPVGARLSRFGITAVTDATPDLDRLDAAALPQHVTALGIPLETAPPPGVRIGPYKIVLADSAPLDLDDLTARIAAAHGTGRAVAVHCVTREALALLLAAFDVVGTRPGDRIEHAALVPADAIAMVVARGLRVVTQPGFLADRGDDYRRDVPAADHPDLYRCASLLAAGVPVALSSDAPHGPLDPWAVIDAAVTRRTPDGDALGPAERLDRAAALAAYLAPAEDPGGAPRRIRAGCPADLVLRSPEEHTVATVIAGRRVA